MSFAAEPYAAFVDDLVTSLTGGVTREDFVFLPERAPFRLGLRGRPRAGDGPRARPVDGRLRALRARRRLRRRHGGRPVVDGAGTGPAGGVTWPDQGSHFYVSYERVPDAQAPPRLTDRNPGSILRTLAESFAREYAVISRQMEAVYLAAFLETAGAATSTASSHSSGSCGARRRSRAARSSSRAARRHRPTSSSRRAPGSRRARCRRCRREHRAANAALGRPLGVRAGAGRGRGRAGDRARDVAHGRQPSDPRHRQRVQRVGADARWRRRDRRLAAPPRRRALETSGRATVGSLIGALTSIEGIRPAGRAGHRGPRQLPGAREGGRRRRSAPGRGALGRVPLGGPPARGIRLLHNLPLTSAGEGSPAPGGGLGTGTPPPAPGVAVGTRYPVGVTVTAVPSRPDLTALDKAALVDQIRTAVAGYVGDLAIGDTLVYNRLVAATMGRRRRVRCDRRRLPDSGRKAVGRRSLGASEPHAGAARGPSNTPFYFFFKKIFFFFEHVAIHRGCTH